MKRIFYGWWMVGAGSVMQFVQGTLLLQSFGAYFAVLRDDRGWSKTELSGAAALLGAWIGDRFDKRILSALCMLGHMSGLLFLTFATGPAMIVAYAILHGAAWGLRGPLMQAIRADYFGRSAIGMILGLSLMIIVVGQVGGPMIIRESPRI